MGDILRRREMMQQAGASPSGALYKLKQGTSSFSRRTTIITGNHIQDTADGSVVARYHYIDGTTDSSSAITADWFTLHSGDVVTIKAKNISFTNRYTHGNGLYTAGLKHGSDTAIVEVALSLTIGTSGTLADTETTVTLSADVVVNSILFYQQRNSDIDYDLEVWVNGIQYI